MESALLRDQVPKKSTVWVEALLKLEPTAGAVSGNISGSAVLATPEVSALDNTKPTCIMFADAPIARHVSTHCTMKVSLVWADALRVSAPLLATTVLPKRMSRVKVPGVVTVVIRPVTVTRRVFPMEKKF